MPNYTIVQLKYCPMPSIFLLQYLLGFAQHEHSLPLAEGGIHYLTSHRKSVTMGLWNQHNPSMCSLACFLEHFCDISHHGKRLKQGEDSTAN